MRALHGSRFEVRGSWFKVQGSRFKVQGSNLDSNLDEKTEDSFFQCSKESEIDLVSEPFGSLREFIFPIYNNHLRLICAD